MNKGLLFSSIMNYVKINGLKLIDDFPLKFTNALYHFINKNEKIPDHNQLKKIVYRIKTNFFQINRSITKTQFIKDIIDIIPDLQSLDIEKPDYEIIKILILASNPKDTSSLRLDEEVRNIIVKELQSGH